MTQLTDPQREVLLAMHGYDSDLIPYVRDLARETDLPVEQVRQILRTFDTWGWVTHGPIMKPAHPEQSKPQAEQSKGAPMGSTWWLTDKGLAAQAEHESAAA